MLSYLKNIPGAVVSLVFSKEFGKGLLIGGAIMAVAVGLHVLVRL